MTSAFDTPVLWESMKDILSKKQSKVNAHILTYVCCSAELSSLSDNRQVVLESGVLYFYSQLNWIYFYSFVGSRLLYLLPNLYVLTEYPTEGGRESCHYLSLINATYQWLFLYNVTLWVEKHIPL